MIEIKCSLCNNDSKFIVAIRDLAPFRVEYWIICDHCSTKTCVYTRYIEDIEAEKRLREKLLAMNNYKGHLA